MYNLIACVNKKGVIGQGNELYATSSKDLYHFSQVTKGYSKKQNALVMGYTTWLSLPTKPLPERLTIVLTKQDRDLEGAICLHSFEEVFKYLDNHAKDVGETFIIGGSSVYEQCLNRYPDQLNKMYITEVDDEWQGNDESMYFTYDSILPQMSLIRCDGQTTDIRIYDPSAKSYVSKECELTFTVYQRSDVVNNEELTYVQLMKDIMEHGTPVEGRNGQVRSSFAQKMTFDLSSFPLLTTKQVGYKTVLRELLWFIKGSTDNQELTDKNVHIWSGNASKEFLESRGLTYEEGDLGPIYGYQWRHFGFPYEDRYTDYTGKGYDQLRWLIQEIKDNPSSRRLILSAWNPAALDQMALPPCHILSQFYVNLTEGTLSCQLYQRSGDMFLGVPFNIASYSFLTYILCKLTGYKPGFLYHVIGDAHVYEEHFEAVNKQCKRIPKPFPTLVVSDELTDIDAINETMFTVEGYEPYTPIKAPMKV
jgi:dihydrofolate reductase/thymidylate synthase